MKSMTGFGRGEVENDQMSVVIELKSVNHRFLDCQFHMPRQLSEWENALRQVVKKEVARGRIDIYVTIEFKVATPKTTHIDWEAIEQVLEETSKESQKRFGFVPDRARLVTQLLQQEEFMTISEKSIALDHYQELIFKALDLAVAHLIDARSTEGQYLHAILVEQQALIQAEYENIMMHTETIEQEQEEKLLQAVRLRVGEAIDDTRILTEVALLLERGDIHEELDRLRVHLQQLTNLIAKPHPIGRELDFLIQEFNREVNTIGSKTASIEIKNSVVALKTTIEKMREQVQNIE